LVDIITKKETQDLILVESLSVVEEAVKRLEKVQGPIGDIINVKVKNVLQKNSGIAKMKVIKNILTGTSTEASLDVELSPSDIVNVQYCPITSVEVERSFSRYKAILRQNRRSFEFENLKMHVVINCNQDN
jgi:CRISPR/Cas system CMR subunit Cmr6 (Cas7 group RAMP superfamily)